jgi:hypothetical protein
MKRTQVSRLEIRARWRNNHDKALPGQGDKCLRSKRMALHGFNPVWQSGFNTASDDPDRNVTIVTHIDAAQIVKAIKSSIVHRDILGPGAFYDLAIRRER